MFVATTNRPSIFPFSSIKSTVFNSSQRVVATTGLFWHSWENTWLSSRTNNVTGKERELGNRQRSWHGRKGVETGRGSRECKLGLNLVQSCASACSWSCAFISFIRWFPKRLKIEFFVFNERREQQELSLSLSRSHSLAPMWANWNSRQMRLQCSVPWTHSQPSLSLSFTLLALFVCARVCV